MPTQQQVPVAPGLFTWPSAEPQLIGSKCRECGVVTFPAQHDCPRCMADAMDEHLLATTGELWTFTTQGFIPKSPPYARVETAETFVPYGVGYVELGGEVRVEGRLTENDPAKLRIGMPMRVVLIPLTEDDDGNEVVTFAFAPVEGASS